MFGALIEKEFKAVLLSPKFVATFATCAGLILLSVFVGILEYQAAVRQYDTATRLAEQNLQEANSWRQLSTAAYRQPDPLQIFISGVSNDIGRFSFISEMQSIKLRQSVYSDDPIFAVFRFIDFAFIVQIVLSLFAILFTYDAVSGERESGTLQLVFSNAVSRPQYLVAKFAGAWLALVIPLLVPVLLSFLLLMIFRVPFEMAHWGKLAALFGVSILSITFFIALGILISAWTRRSSVSFLIALVTWVILVLIAPRIGVMAAGQLISVPSVAEIEGQQNAFEKDRWNQHIKELQQRWQAREAGMATMTESEREAYRESQEQTWREEDERDRRAMQEEINDFSQKLLRDLRLRKAEQERLAFLLARFSPASTFQLAAMQLAGAGIDLKDRYEEAMQGYRTAFVSHVEKKQKESGGMGGMRIEIGSDGRFSVQAPREKGKLNVSDMPKFQDPKHDVARALQSAVLDIGLLGLYVIGSFAGAVIGFLRYDVR